MEDDILANPKGHKAVYRRKEIKKLEKSSKVKRHSIRNRQSEDQ